jgi:hypothetical protein
MSTVSNHGYAYLSRSAMDYFRKSREDSFMKLTIGNIRLFILLATFFLDSRDRANFPNCILVLKT